MTGSLLPDLQNVPPPDADKQEIIRLLVIPLLVYIAWLIEIYLLDSSLSLFATLVPVLFLLYTAVGCILIGTLVPVYLIRRSFLYRTVNMLQIGFRPIRRTITLCTITGSLCILVLLLFSPAGYSRLSLVEVFLLYLPTAIATVMICWVLIGTHLQALVRSGGIAISISVSVVITSVLFGLSSVVHTSISGSPAPVVPVILLGMITALFFFAVRDVYATVIVLTTGMAILFSGLTNPAVLDGSLLLVLLSALAGLAVLFLVHFYFSRNYTTVIVVPD
jgi:hypothetical protein